MTFNKEKILQTLFSALSLVTTIFVYGPIIIFQGNIDAFGISLVSMLNYFIVPFFLVLALLIFIGILLPEKIHQLFVVLVISLSVLLWIQGTFIVWNLGVLDGTTIDWSKQNWKGFLDGVIWISFFLLAIIQYRKFYKYIIIVSLFLLLSHILFVGAITFQNPKIWTKTFRLPSEKPKEVFQFSSKQNVIHIVLDQFGAPLFERVISKNKQFLDELQGFTYFRDIITSTPVTYLSVPAFLSGGIYENDIPVQEFYKLHYLQDNIHTTLFNNGYDLDIVTNAMFGKREIDKYYYNIPTPYSTLNTNQFRIYKATFLADLVLFRFSPYYLKKYIYNDQSWWLSSISLPENNPQFEHFSANEFLSDFDKYASISRNENVYKYIHLMSPHPPLVIDGTGRYAGAVLAVTPENFEYQAEYTFKNVMKVLNRLKNLNLYNSSLIIIHSDHGSGIPFNVELSDGKIVSNEKTFIPSDAFLPLFLIKPPYSNTLFRTSNVQGELIDLPATICSVLDLNNRFPGKSLFDIDSSEVRKRKAYYSFTTHRNDAMVSGFFAEMQEYIISGSAYKISSWKESQILKKSLQFMIWGNFLRFQKEGNVLPYLEHGWGMPEDQHIWSNGKNASIKLPIINIPKTDIIKLECEVKPFLVPSRGINDQQIITSINGTVIGREIVTNEGVKIISMTFPTKLIKGSQNILVNFDFPNAKKACDYGFAGDDRFLSFAFFSMTFKEIN